MSKLPRTVFRPLDGILLLDKPPGMSSNQALQRVRHLFRAEKAGHTGSLDPLATGLLPVCFGEATKIAGYLLGSSKGYEVEARLGVTTDTDDADGVELRTRRVPNLTVEQVEQALRRFLGAIRQRPPIYSALKQGGEPLYAKARRGEAIEVPERLVQVDSIELLSLAGDRLSLRIACGTGTYIRSIVRDLGEDLDCGAHVTSLRRSWVAPFVKPEMHTLEALQSLASAEGEAALDRLLLPVDTALVGWTSVELDASQVSLLGFGQAIQTSTYGTEGPVNAIGPEGRSLGVAELQPDGMLRAKRLFRWAVGPPRQ